MESAIVHLEQSVQKADIKLEMIAWKIDAVEKEFQDPDNEISVVHLLSSVHQVTKDYQNLRQEILEVQQLQKQLSDSLRVQLSQVHGHFNLLRNKIVGQKTPQLKAKKNLLKNLPSTFCHFLSLSMKAPLSQ